MRSLSTGGWPGPDDRGDPALEEFAALWQAGVPSLEQFWARIRKTRSLVVLGMLVKIDIDHRFARGERPSAADYLERFPELARSGERALSLIYEEFCLLEQAGEDPDSVLFCERYAPWRDSLRSQLAYHRELSRVVGAEVKPTRYPKPGERFDKYHLRSILGTGGAGRVYLATEDGLGGRKVALKISASIGQEPSILANLDHRNIVPILTVAESDDGLWGFCMPYRPGATLEKVIQRLGSKALPRSARSLWEALEPVEPDGPDDLEGDRAGWSDFPRSGTYPEAVAWIGLSLTNALVYLHDHGVVHRDIKPANVLLAYRDGPQLLDFNLAHAPSAPEQAKAALKGGTLPYMAPEQLRAFLDPEAWEKVGAPADIYALGLVLRGLLTGQAPDLPDPRLPLARAIGALHDRRAEPAPPVREYNPGVPPALESILAKCLEFDPADRYTDAAELAEDFRHFLDRRPLRYAENTSSIERGVNWIYRNRLAVGALACVIAASATVLLVLAMLPERSAIEKEFTWSELGQFRQAVRDLDSEDRASWIRARDAFRSLCKAHPDLAWPLLYESLTLEKIGIRTRDDESRFEANKKLKSADRMRDYDHALKQRLKEDPRSVTLLVRKAERLINNPSGDQTQKQPIELLRDALAIEPGRFEALAVLADVERKAGRSDEAIRLYSRAIEIAEKAPGKYRVPLATCREQMLPLLTKQADALIEKDRLNPGRPEAARFFGQSEAILLALENSWAEGRPQASPDKIESYHTLYSGSIASGRAAIAAETGNIDAARDKFREAGDHFDRAMKVAERSPQYGALQSLVEANRGLLTLRKEKFLGQK